MFHSNAEATPYGAVYVVPSEGGKVRQVTSNPTTDAFASFSADGGWIYFSSSRTEPPSIWKVPVSGGEAVQVSPKAGVLALESRDGAYLYLSRAEIRGAGAVVASAAQGRRTEKLIEDVMSTGFDVLEGGIYYLERLPGKHEASIFRFRPTPLNRCRRKLGSVSL